jgi:hypothetical protein
MDQVYSISPIYSSNMTKLVNGQPDYMLTLKSGSLISRHYCDSYIEAIDLIVLLRLPLTDEDKGLYKLNKILKQRVS